jgi:hypothetical protein
MKMVLLAVTPEVEAGMTKDIPGTHVLFVSSSLDNDIYKAWFDKNSNSWSSPQFGEYNWMFLRHQQNWANDLLRARGHLFLNEIRNLLGLPHTAIGAIVGWVYSEVKPENGGNFVDFGCWSQEDAPIEDAPEGEGILLNFNVQGSILHHLA